MLSDLIAHVVTSATFENIHDINFSSPHQSLYIAASKFGLPFKSSQNCLVSWQWCCASAMVLSDCIEGSLDLGFTCE